MSFHIDCAERACRTQVLTCAAADAAFGIDNGYFGGLRISGVRSHHLYGADRAVASAVAALHLIGDADAILLYPYGMTYLDGRFVGFRYRPDSTCRTNFRTLGTFGTAVAALVGHFRLHQPCQLCKVACAQRPRRSNGGGTCGYLLVFDGGQSAVYFLLLRL